MMMHVIYLILYIIDMSSIILLYMPLAASCRIMYYMYITVLGYVRVHVRAIAAAILLSRIT